MIREYTARGQCLGKDYCDAFLMTDTEAPIFSGDFVVVLVRRPGDSNVYAVAKYLEMTRDGKWWLVCHDGIGPISPDVVVPAAIEKVVARRGAGGYLHAPFEQQPASRELLEYLDQRSREARLEWAQMGKPWGVKFPGLDAIIERPPEFRLPENFYAQSAPREASLSITNNINGTISFSIATPNVRPRGTTYQIIRSLSSSDAAAGTVVYDGTTQRVDLPSWPTTAFYWSRAYANSSYGPYSPNSTGLAAAPGGFSTDQIAGAAITDVNVANDAGPLTSTLTAPASSGGYQVKYIELTITAGYSVEVTVSGRFGVSTAAGAGTWTVQIYALAGSVSFPNVACGQPLVKDTNAYEMFSVVGLHTPVGGGTFRYGLGVFINGDGTHNFDAIARDVTVRVTTVKR